MKRYLILDCNFLAHRAKHVFGDLSYAGSATGVIYGFLKDILALSQKFSTQDFIFCWDDSLTSKRKEIYPEYKGNRVVIERTEDELAFDKEFHKQVYLLRTEYLSMIGFANNFWQAGYEADDIMAAIVENIELPDEAIIVTADKDLFQCICSNVSCYNPITRVETTRHIFYKRYNIKPYKWAKVKAIAGCPTDNVKGIVGVGEKTAIKFLQKELNPNTKAYKNIIAGWDMILDNKKLVDLPFRGTLKPKLSRDNVSQQSWNSVTKLLGMKSIRIKKVRKD